LDKHHLAAVGLGADFPPDDGVAPDVPRRRAGGAGLCLGFKARIRKCPRRVPDPQPQHGDTIGQHAEEAHGDHIGQRRNRGDLPICARETPPSSDTSVKTGAEAASSTPTGKRLASSLPKTSSRSLRSVISNSTRVWRSFSWAMRLAANSGAKKRTSANCTIE